MDQLNLQGFHAVQPKTDCPHCTPENILTLEAILANNVKVTDPCKTCQATGEVWVCLKCTEVHCSRYIEGHMALHNV